MGGHSERLMSKRSVRPKKMMKAQPSIAARSDFPDISFSFFKNQPGERASPSAETNDLRLKLEFLGQAQSTRNDENSCC